MSSSDKELQHRASRRLEHVTTAAYYYFERRGFAPGGEMEDWLLAEREIDASTASSGGMAGVSQRDAPESAPLPLQDGAQQQAIHADEVQSRADRQSVSAESLRTAISKVGPLLDDVKAHLMTADSVRKSARRQ